MYMQLRMVLLLLALQMGSSGFAQPAPSWTREQLMEPAELAARLQSGKNLPTILSVGPGAYIPHSTDIGMVSEKENLEKLRNQLKPLARDTPVVIYCGCCPFAHCPNVGPAIQVLKDLKFTRFKLLNLEHNIRVDWIAKGYPVAR